MHTTLHVLLSPLFASLLLCLCIPLIVLPVAVSDPKLSALDSARPHALVIKTAGDILSRKASGDVSLFTINADSTVSQAIHHIISNRVGFLIVTKDSKAIGILVCISSCVCASLLPVPCWTHAPLAHALSLE